MRNIVVGAQVSLDGVMQAPGGPTEDPTDGFRLGGWSIPYFDQEAGEEMMSLFQSFDLLLGRKTYEIFAGYWPYYDDGAPDGGIAKTFNEVNKYVVSRSGDVDSSWERSVVLRDLAAVKQLKQEAGPNLVTQGSTELLHALFVNDLVDRLSTFTVPVVLGRGKKLFADGAAPHSFKLIRSSVSSSGVVISHYEREGAVRTADTELVAPSARELARRRRMLREG